MQPDAINAAAATLWQHWTASTRIHELPAGLRPATRADGYAIQTALASVSGQKIVGWKIAATSRAGQSHIGVDGPLAGCLLANRMLESGARVSLAGNLMRVAEAEFAFRLKHTLPRRDAPYERNEVLAAVESMHPAIELPDSRFLDFAKVGAPQLIADDACAWWLVVGAATIGDWRATDLAEHPVVVQRNGVPETTGRGANVLGDPRLALTWLANELRTYGAGLQPGDLVTTGTCITPLRIGPGERVRADFGSFGAVEVSFPT
jgi:2-keto-4-pentenoate hydratase